jgi:hypothetical protein
MAGKDDNIKTDIMKTVCRCVPELSGSEQGQILRACEIPIHANGGEFSV